MRIARKHVGDLKNIYFCVIGKHLKKNSFFDQKNGI